MAKCSGCGITIKDNQFIIIRGNKGAIIDRVPACKDCITKSSATAKQLETFVKRQTK